MKNDTFDHIIKKKVDGHASSVPADMWASIQARSGQPPAEGQDDLDQVIKDKVDGHASKVPAEVWPNILAMMTRRRRRVPVIFWWLLLLFGSAVLTFSLGHMLFGSADKAEDALEKTTSDTDVKAQGPMKEDARIGGSSEDHSSATRAGRINEMDGESAHSTWMEGTPDQIIPDLPSSEMTNLDDGTNLSSTAKPHDRGPRHANNSSSVEKTIPEHDSEDMEATDKLEAGSPTASKETSSRAGQSMDRDLQALDPPSAGVDVNINHTSVPINDVAKGDPSSSSGEDREDGSLARPGMNTDGRVSSSSDPSGSNASSLGSNSTGTEQGLSSATTMSDGPSDMRVGRREDIGDNQFEESMKDGSPRRGAVPQLTLQCIDPSIFGGGSGAAPAYDPCGVKAGKGQKKLNCYSFVKDRQQVFFDMTVGPRVVSKRMKAQSVGDTDDVLIRLREDTESHLIGLNATARFGFKFYNGTMVSTGLTYDRFLERFDYFNPAENRPLESLIIIDSTFNSLGQPIYTYDTISTTVIGQRRVKHTNSMTRFSIPITFGYQWRKPKFDVGLHLGVAMNIAFAQSGRIMLGEDDIGSLDAELDEPIYQTTVGASFMAGGYVAYRLNREWSLLVEPTFQTDLNSLTASSYAIDQRHMSIGINLGIRRVLIDQVKSRKKYDR